MPSSVFFYSVKLTFGRYDYACFAAFTAYACCSLIIPVALVTMARDLEFPLEDGGMGAGGRLHLIRSVAMVISLLSCSLLAAKIGKRWSMGIAMLLMGSGIFLCAFSPVYWFLLPCLMIAGIGEGICEGLATPFVHDLHTDAPSNYINTAHSFWSVGTGLVVILGGFLLTIGLHWRIIIAATGLICISTALGFIWKENPNHKYPETMQKTGSSNLLTNSWAICKSIRFWIYCLGMFMGAGAEFCLTFWSSSYIQLNFNTSPWLGGLGTAFIALGMFTGRYSFGKYVKERHLIHLLLITGVAGIPVTGLVALITPDTLGSHGLSLALMFLLIFLSGICVAPYWPCLQSYGVAMLPKLDSTLLFVYFSSIGIPGCGFFTWLMGVAGDHYGLRQSFVLIPITLLLFSLIIFLEGFVFPPKLKTSCHATA